jgi:hypothetical protein
MEINKTIEWLLDGDISVQYQVYKDLLHSEEKNLRDRISEEGWGKDFLSFQNCNGHWGSGFYSPKWTSSHYTLLDLRNLYISPEIPQPKLTVNLILKNDKCGDGGVNPSKTLKLSDVCLNGMFLNYSSYFKASEDKLQSIVDFLLSQQLKDGGFNCHSNRIGAVHSSLHTTLSVIEGIREFILNGYKYRLIELQNAELSAREFILQHKLFQSDRTGKIIDHKMLLLSWPSRWRYDILRVLDYFRYAETPFDIRMQDAINIVRKKQKTDLKWPLQAKHKGTVHFDMEKPGEPSRWNTLRALRVLNYFDKNNFKDI